MSICRLESGGNPKATNWHDSHKGCNGSFGLYQVACLHGVSKEKLYNPVTNIEVAYSLWKSEGWKPWTTFKLLAKK